MTKVIRYIIFLLMCCILFSCSNDEEDKQRIPWAPVVFEIRINAEDETLKTPSNMAIYVSSKAEKDAYDAIITTNNVKNAKTFIAPRKSGEYVGISGLLVVSSPIVDSDGSPTLLVYDLCCPHEDSKSTTVYPTKEGYLVCNKCNTVYDPYSGIPQSGPSKESLQNYKWRKEQPYNGIFHIYR